MSELEAKDITLPDLPTVTLSNGLTVANYSSPHPFTFTDGTILPACSNERATLTMLETNEICSTYTLNGVEISDVRIDWRLTEYLKVECNDIIWAMRLNILKWDIILVPLPFMTAWKHHYEHAYHYTVPNPPFRVIRVADRITKEIHIDKFCV